MYFPQKHIFFLRWFERHIFFRTSFLNELSWRSGNSIKWKISWCSETILHSFFRLSRIFISSGMFCDKNCTKQIQNSLSILLPKNQLLDYSKLYNILKLHQNIFHSTLFPAFQLNSFRNEVLKKMRRSNHLKKNICFWGKYISISKLSGRQTISCKGLKSCVKKVQSEIFQT